MRRLFWLALVALLAFDRPASAAVGSHTYTITGGSSFGVSNVGTITGGTFVVNFPVTPIFCQANCVTGPYIINLTFMGTAGTYGHPAWLGTMEHAFQGGHPNPYGAEVSVYFTDVANTPAYIQRVVRFNGDHDGGDGVLNIVDRFLTHTISSGIVQRTTVLGGVGFTAEVSVPEPSHSALLATAGLMLGAYALSRARRSLG